MIQNTKIHITNLQVTTMYNSVQRCHSRFRDSEMRLSPASLLVKSYNFDVKLDNGLFVLVNGGVSRSMPPNSTPKASVYVKEL
jgi:hypothetical protein